MKLSSLSTSWQGRSLEDVYKKRRGLWMRKKWGERSIPRGPEGPVTARSHERLHGYSWGDLSTFGRPPLLWITFAGLQAQGPPWVFPLPVTENSTV
jgi:hypothetical protein